MRKCENCKKNYIGISENQRQRWCSEKCSKEFKYGGDVPIKNISSGTIGAVAELIVSLDLMKRGYEVYRALSPASSCDILALKGKKVFTIEVRTGYKSKDNKTIITNRFNMRAKYLAIVIHRTNEIIYEPDFFKI